MKEYNYILPITGIPRKLPGNVIRYKVTILLLDKGRTIKI